jgi:hypothetical protein
MRVLRWLVITLAVLIALPFAVMGAARFADGPIGPFPGGPLRSGEMVSDAGVDWSFAELLEEIELQLVEPPRSRTVWVLVHEGQVYIPCSLSFPPGKRWHEEAMVDGRAVVRMAGRRYERRLVRVTDAETLEALRASVGRKYGPPPGGSAEAWFFRLDPPVSSVSAS